MSTTQIDLASASGVGPFDITGLDLVANNRIPYEQQLSVQQNGSEIALTDWSIDANLGTITFTSDIAGLDTKIFRQTPNDLAVQFVDGARLPAQDLTDAFGQVMNRLEEQIQSPVSGLSLDDLSDVGAPGDTPALDDILVYDGLNWAFANRGSLNTVNADQVATAYNSSDAETTLEALDNKVDTIEDNTQEITHVGTQTQIGDDLRVSGDTFLDGALNLGSGNSLAADEFEANKFTANTTNGAEGIEIVNSGTGYNGSMNIASAADGQGWALTSPGGRFDIVTGGSTELRVDQNSTSVYGQLNKTAAYGGSSTEVMNRGEMDQRYLFYGATGYIDSTNSSSTWAKNETVNSVQYRFPVAPNEVVFPYVLQRTQESSGFWKFRSNCTLSQALAGINNNNQELWQFEYCVWWGTSTGNVGSPVGTCTARYRWGTNTGAALRASLTNDVGSRNYGFPSQSLTNTYLVNIRANKLRPLFAI